ncbi:MAG: alginate lyase family protein, partial [Candidatus Hydrogenedentes bacterium]|nr:alginate lyase family protein [Candidatus Hydrogenedentota bacterium]
MGHVILSMGLGILCLCGAFAAGAEEGGSIRMDEPAFFRALELDAAELGAVRAAVDAEDWAGARAAFVGHLKARERPRWHRDWRERPRTPTPPGKPGKNQRIADDALEHRFTSTGLAHEFDGPIDWAHNPTAEPDSERAHNPEWTWQFNRHPFWQSLGWAYWETGDERYAEEFVREMTDWVRANPVPEPRADQARFSRWRTIEAGIRMGHSWPDAFALFLSSPSFSDEAVVTMVRSMAEHARYLLAHPTKGNWLTMEMNGLYTVGALFPELRESAAWRRFAAERLRTELDTQFYPDGAQKELAPGYHFVALENTRCVLRLAQLNGLEVPAGYAASMERLYTYPLMLMTPDRGLPPFNDSRWRANGLPRRMAEGHGHFPARDDFLWVATDGKEGRPPAETSHAFPYAGYVIQRSGWDRDARYLAFDAGPFGTGHQHEDKLNFVLMAYGRRLIVEGGIYMYDASPWRRYVLGPYAHNVVFVDGLGQNRRAAPETREAAEPLPFVWHTTDRVDYAQASYGGASEGYGQEPQWIATHTRRILFVKNGADAP